MINRFLHFILNFLHFIYIYIFLNTNNIFIKSVLIQNPLYFPCKVSREKFPLLCLVLTTFHNLVQSTTSTLPFTTSLHKPASPTWESTHYSPHISCQFPPSEWVQSLIRKPPLIWAPSQLLYYSSSAPAHPDLPLPLIYSFSLFFLFYPLIIHCLYTIT